YPRGYGPLKAGPGGRSPLLTTRSRRMLNVDSPEATLRTLGLELPEPPRALASYVPVQQVGELLYTSGVIPSWNGEVKFRGVVGGEVSLKDAARAAEICALNIMALVRQHAGSPAQAVASAASGSQAVKVAPLPGSLWASMLPLCTSTIDFAMARPSPDPPADRSRALSPR